MISEQNEWDEGKIKFPANVNWECKMISEMGFDGSSNFVYWPLPVDRWYLQKGVSSWVDKQTDGKSGYIHVLSRK